MTFVGKGAFVERVGKRAMKIRCPTNSTVGRALWSVWERMGGEQRLKVVILGRQEKGSEK